MGSGSRPARRSRCMCGNESPVPCLPALACTVCVLRRVPITTPNTAANRKQPGDRSGRMRADSAVVEEWPVWLEVNGEPAVTWMCTPDQLEELAVGWLKGENRKRVLASGCGAVATMLADPEAMSRSAPLRGEPPAPETLRALFKQLFASGARYNETGGIHAAALTDSTTLLFHAEDIGRHNAVDKVIGGAVLARTPITGRGLLVTGRISAELAFKAARAGLAWVATPSVPSTLAVTIAERSGMVLVGRAVSGTPHVHKREG